MPYTKDTVFEINLLTDMRTQTAPFFLSDKGRYIWSEEPFKISFNKGEISVMSLYDAEIALENAGSTLRDAYIHAKERYFPFEKDIHIPREFLKYPMFNTWIELTF